MKIENLLLKMVDFPGIVPPSFPFSGTPTPAPDQRALHEIPHIVRSPKVIWMTHLLPKPLGQSIGISPAGGLHPTWWTLKWMIRIRDKMKISI